MTTFPPELECLNRRCKEGRKLCSCLTAPLMGKAAIAFETAPSKSPARRILVLFAVKRKVALRPLTVLSSKGGTLFDSPRFIQDEKWSG